MDLHIFSCYFYPATSDWRALQIESLKIPQETQHEHEAERDSLSLAWVSRCMVLGNSSNRDNNIKNMINFVSLTLLFVIGIRETAGDDFS